MNRVKTKATPGVMKQMGFTLIELSIVLVIIGLIVGGVLVGQDLIKAAEIRATISQYEKYNSAVNTFRTKYDGIPGDLTAATAGAFGLGCAGTTTACTTGVTGMGNGNGLIAAADGSGNQSGDALFFWRQLSDANLIDGSYGASTTAITLTTGLATTIGPAALFPAAKTGRGVYWTAGSASGLNYYMLATISATTADAAGATYTASSGLTPLEAFNIDSKLDDGAPNAGIIQARGTATTGALLFPVLSVANIGNYAATEDTAARCQIGASNTAAANTYARGATAGNSPNCQLRMRFN